MLQFFVRAPFKVPVFPAPTNRERRVEFSISIKLEGGSSRHKVAIFIKNMDSKFNFCFLEFLLYCKFCRSKIEILSQTFYEAHHKLPISVSNTAIG